MFPLGLLIRAADQDPVSSGYGQIRIRSDPDPVRSGSGQIRIRSDQDPVRSGSRRIQMFFNKSNTIS